MAARTCEWIFDGVYGLKLQANESKYVRRLFILKSWNMRR
jgi:hypothetical protein